MNMGISETFSVRVSIPLHLARPRRHAVDGRDALEVNNEQRRPNLSPLPSSAVISQILSNANNALMESRQTAGLLPGCSPSCSAIGVLDLLENNPAKFTFTEAYEILGHCNVDLFRDVMKKVIVGYSMNIYNFPDCPDEDLLLAVYLFLDDVLGIAVDKMHLCVRYAEDEDDPDVVGVVLDSIPLKRRIMKKSRCLKDTGIVLSDNHDMGWILDGFCSD